MRIVAPANFTWCLLCFNLATTGVEKVIFMARIRICDFLLRSRLQVSSFKFKQAVFANYLANTAVVDEWFMAVVSSCCHFAIFLVGLCWQS